MAWSDVAAEQRAVTALAYQAFEQTCAVCRIYRRHHSKSKCIPSALRTALKGKADMSMHEVHHDPPHTASKQASNQLQDKISSQLSSTTVHECRLHCCP